QSAQSALPPDSSISTAMSPDPPASPGYPELAPSNATALHQSTWPRDERHSEQGVAQATETSARTEPTDSNGLTPLDEPNSLDALGWGTSAAGPFVTAAEEPVQPAPVPEAAAPQQAEPAAAQQQEPAWPVADDDIDRFGNESQPAAVPRAQPQNVPLADDQWQSDQ